MQNQTILAITFIEHRNKYNLKLKNKFKNNIFVDCIVNQKMKKLEFTFFKVNKF